MQEIQGATSIPHFNKNHDSKKHLVPPVQLEIKIEDWDPRLKRCFLMSIHLPNWSFDENHDSRYQDKNEFTVEIKENGKVKHKNLVDSV
jgi:hypothetical protein